jgi:hypothetical protein
MNINIWIAKIYVAFKINIETNIWDINKNKIVTYMSKKTNPIILKATYILAIQMLIFIGSFYWLYKVLKHHLQHFICKEKFQKCDHRFGNTFTFWTDIPFAVHFNCAEKILHLREELQHMTIVRIFFTFL